MQVEALERIISDGRSLETGDRATVPDEVGRNWCRHGWAKDLAGQVATGERRVNKVVVEPHGSAHDQAADEASGD